MVCVYSIWLYFLRVSCTFFFFFFNDTATTEIYTLSLHDALPIFHFRYKCHLDLFLGEELFGTKIYKPNKIMVLVLDEINEDLVLGSSVAGLLTETVIDLVRHDLVS